MIPDKFPFESNRLDRITPTSFYESAEFSIAIQVAGGGSQIIDALDLAMSNIRIKDLKKIDGIAIFYDADNNNAVQRKQLLFKKIDEKLDICFDKNFFVNNSGIIRGIRIKSGIFIFPNNRSNGTLENLLLECAELEYKNLLDNSKEYIEKIDPIYKARWY